jgi:biotin transport system substrate-specific component
MLGSKLGALSQLIYVVLGLIGIPVFTKGGGLSYIFEPSFGYLIGFILAACIIGVPYLYIVLKNVNNVQITV